MEVERKRQFRSKQERRAIVEETLQAGASVSRVARAHNVNTNQVFYWRKQYREGWFDESAGSLIPVRVSREAGGFGLAHRASSRQARCNPTGLIEIAWGTIRVRIEGAADPSSIRAVMDSLGR